MYGICEARSSGIASRFCFVIGEPFVPKVFSPDSKTAADVFRLFIRQEFPQHVG